MKTTNKNRFFYLLSFSGRYKYLSILGCILSAVAAICAMMPFYYIWKFVDAICLAFPNINNAQNLENYAIMALTFAILNLVIYFFALMSTHLSAFHNEKNMKQKAVDFASLKLSRQATTLQVYRSSLSILPVMTIKAEIAYLKDEIGRAHV